jgi:hypothetical protein
MKIQARRLQRERGVSVSVAETSFPKRETYDSEAPIGGTPQVVDSSRLQQNQSVRSIGVRADPDYNRVARSERLVS